MIRYGNPQEVLDYFADSSASQSYLKQLIKGVEYLDKKEEVLYYEEKGHFVIGSAVDVRITQGVANYNEQYYVSEGQKPSDTIISMVHMVFDNNVVDEVPTGGVLEDFTEDILEALNFHKYQMRWKEPTRIQKIIDEGAEYFEELKEAHGKIVLSGIEATLVSRIVMSLKSNKYTNEYFKDNPDIDIFYQMPIFFVCKDIPCKALLDMVVVNHANKRVYPIDIKTMGDFTKNFPWAVKGRGYNFQGAFYTEALLEIKLNRAKTLVEFPDIFEYEIMPFKFIVETTKFWKNPLTEEVTYYQGKPLVYRLSQRQMNLGRIGRPMLMNSVIAPTGQNMPIIPIQPIVGFEEALDLHHWHTENGFEEDKKMKVNNGVILIE